MLLVAFLQIKWYEVNSVLTWAIICCLLVTLTTQCILIHTLACVIHIQSLDNHNSYM